MELILALDRSLFLLVNHGLAHPLLDAFFVAVTDGRFWVVPGAAAAAFFVRARGRGAVAPLLLAALTVLISDQVCCSVVKPLVDRLRPCDPSGLVEGGRFLLGLKTSASFPSAHAANMFAQAALWSLLYRRWAAVFFGFALLIAYSRVYVGVHYPLDVAGGAALGICVGASVWGLYAGALRLIRRNAVGQPG